MLTTTVDGLWALQVLSGIEVVAPELGLRPHLPSAETRSMALHHPVSTELRNAGVISPEGDVDPPVLEWLTVLSRRDRALLLYGCSAASDSIPDRILLAGYTKWWVALERCGPLIRLSGVGTANTEPAVGQVIGAQIDRFCGSREPATFRPVTVDVDELLSSVDDRRSLLAFLSRQNLDADQWAALMRATDHTQSSQIVVVAVRSRTSGISLKSHIGEETVTIIDSPVGRITAEHVRRDGRSWMVVAPGTARHTASAVRRLMAPFNTGDRNQQRRAV